MKPFQFFSNLSIGLKLTLVTAAVLGVLLAVVLVLLIYSVSDLTVRTGEARVDQEVNVIHSRFDEAQQNLLAASKLLSTTPSLTKALDEEDVAAVRTAVVLVSAPLDFDEVVLVDATGSRLVEVAPGNEPFKSAHKEDLLELALLGIETGEVIAEGEELHLATVVPLRSRSGPIIGGLLTSQEIDDGFLEEINFSREDIYPGLIHDGRILARTSRAGARVTATETAGSSKSLDEAVLGDGTPATASDLVRIDGNPYARGYFPLTMNGETPAAIAVLVDVGKPVSFQNQLTTRLTIVFALLSLAAIATVAFLTRQSVSIPQLRALRATADRMASGDYGRRAPETTKDEVGQLASSFNTMSDAVQRHAAGLSEANRALRDEITQREELEEQLSLANEELRERNRQLMDARAQAATDALTGLWNHRAFHERAREEAHRAQDNGSPLSLIMLDIDGFKRINDSQGHMSGDQILRALANTLTEVAPRQHAYRYGGDEFAVLLPGADGRKTARVAEQLRRAVEREVNGSGEKVTVSLGVACLPDSADSAEELIYGADAAMYWAKSAGKNRVGDWGKLLGQREEGALPWYAADRGVKAPDVVSALVAALAAKDPTTAGHTERCSWYTAKLATELDLEEKETSMVRLASLLHDVGKIAVPDEVLFKPGPLNEEEWAQMKKHSSAAMHVLSQVRSITDATPAILHHHEHFDGSGYPDGVAGEQIPIASRILLVTDAFDAMTTDRPYRKAMPVEAAIEELKRHSGSQFDPAVVDAFLRVLAREGAQPLRRTAAAQARPVAAGTTSDRAQ